jgi:opacity protein-like surface antigen
VIYGQYRRPFNIGAIVKFFLLTMLYAQASLAEFKTESNLPSQKTGELIGIPSRPSENKYTYYLSASQQFFHSRNLYAPLNSQTTGNTKTISFNKKQSEKLEWGVNYDYADQKWTSLPSDYIWREQAHGVDPYLTYYFDANAYWSGWVGKSMSSVKITSDGSSSAALAKTRSGNDRGGVQFGVWEYYGPWKSSLDAILSYGNTKTKQYTFSDGSFYGKEHSSALQGQCMARLDLNKFEAFQPYVKAGYQNVLRRSKQYSIQNWDGWIVGAGGSFYGSKKWNASLGYEYNKMPTGDRQSLFILSLAMNF